MVWCTVSKIFNSRRICLSVWMVVVAIAFAPLVVAEEPVAPPRFDLYGDPLPAGAIARLGTIRFRYPATLGVTVFSPDSKWLACAYADGAIIVWDTEGKIVRQFSGDPKSAVTALAFSGDMKMLVSAGNDSVLRVWPIADGVISQEIKVAVYADKPLKFLWN